jgi:hypothetical protein
MSEKVSVFYGPYEGSFDFAGKSVSSVKLSLGDSFQIPIDSVAFVGGKRVNDSHLLGGGDTIEFVRERGTKATSTTEPELAFSSIATMDLVELAIFVDSRLASFHQTQKQALLHSHKSAVNLFWAGCALARAKELCLERGIDDWKSYKAEHSLPNTTVNEAIRLYQNAKTPEALTGLGVTEAKRKFGVDKQKPKSPKSTTKKSLAKGKEKPERGKDEDTPRIQVDPEETVVAGLNEVAQQLIEIAQDQLGKVDLQKAALSRINRALEAITQAVNKIQARIGNE